MIVLHRLGAPVRKRHVVFGGTTRIGAASQADAHVRLLQAARFGPRPGGRRIQIRLVEVEVDRLQITGRLRRLLRRAHAQDVHALRIRAQFSSFVHWGTEQRPVMHSFPMGTGRRTRRPGNGWSCRSHPLGTERCPCSSPEWRRSVRHCTDDPHRNRQHCGTADICEPRKIPCPCNPCRCHRRVDFGFTPSCRHDQKSPKHPKHQCGSSFFP